MLSRLDLFSRSKQTTHWELCNSGRSLRTVGDIRWLSRAGCESGRAEARPAAAATMPRPRRTHVGRSPACTRSGKGVHVLCPCSATSTADPRSAVEMRLVVLCGCTALFWSSLQEYSGKSAPRALLSLGVPSWAENSASVHLYFTKPLQDRATVTLRNSQTCGAEEKQHNMASIMLSSAGTCGVLRPCTALCYLPVSPAPEQKPR